MTNKYTKETIERFLKPKHLGEIKNADGVGKAGNPCCGDEMMMYIKVKDGKIKKASFHTYGCVAAIATSDVVCEIIVGKTLEEAVAITEKEVIAKIKSLPVIKVHCSLLALEGLRSAIKDYEKRKK